MAEIVFGKCEFKKIYHLLDILEVQVHIKVQENSS